MSFLLPLFLCTCGPALPDGPPPLSGTEWLLTEGKPLSYYNNGNSYEGFRLSIGPDSARLYHPLRDVTERYRAFPADADGNDLDSEYLTYEVTTDSTLAVRIHAGGKAHDQSYRPTSSLGAYPLTDKALDNTYRLVLEQHPYLLTFANLPFGEEETRLVANLYSLDTSAQRHVGELSIKVASPVMRDGTAGMYFTYIHPETGDRHMGNLLVSSDAEGEIQIHRNLNVTVSDPLPERIVPELYPGQLPLDYSRQAVLNLLNRGRISVRQLTAEPDSVGIQYAYREDFERRGGISPEELDRLDFEFAADGSYHAFAGDRLIAEGDWSISPDRNFIRLPRYGSGGGVPSLIQYYEEDRISFPLTLKMMTSTPRGEQLLSYYDAEVILTFEAEG